MYDSDCNKFKLKFLRNVVVYCNYSKYLRTMDPYNSPEVDIHMDIVGSRGSFMMVINAQHEDHYENEESITGCSQTI